VLFACVVLEASNRPISEGATRDILTMFHGNKLAYLFRYISEKGFIVFSRCEGRKRFYTLTDQGRDIAAQLLDGIDTRQAVFFNKYLS
jgi:hypothetical protein